VAELASFYKDDRTVGEVLRRMQCRRLRWTCAGAWLETGAIHQAVAVPLLGLEVRE
jgi:hypothetical protein